MLANVALAGLNLVLALVLGAVYLRNHWEIKSPFTLGLLLFAAFLVLHNGMVVYHFATMMPSFVAVDETWVLIENLLQLAGLAALVSATLR
jgi:hypothetical protein